MMILEDDLIESKLETTLKMLKPWMNNFNIII